MNKLKWIFVSCSLLIAMVAFFWLNRPDFSLTVAEKNHGSNTAGFQITRISEKGNLFINRDESRLAEIKNSVFSAETRLKADDQTAWEFFFEKVMFTALPGSGIHYTPQTKELILENGEFYWQKKPGSQSAEISVIRAGNVFRPSDAGRIRLSGKSMEIWNYSGRADIDFNGKRYHLREAQYLNTWSGGTPSPTDLFPAPNSISPENEILSLISANDTIIQFKWKNVRGANGYLLKLYPSPLRENMLFSKTVADNAVILDILPFIEHSELYWEVAALDEPRNLESIPTRMGVIKISSSLLKKGTLSMPPAIEVTSLSVSGNMVLIKGGTDANAQFEIEGVVVKLDSEGKFIHTISYKSIGVKSIVFRAVAPSGLETILKKQVTIFEE